MNGATVKELFNLSGKVALVTGGARNLGYDMALALAEAGATVAITSRTLDHAIAAAQRIAKETGAKANGFKCDVSDETSVDHLVDAVLNEFGKIDILVNNAGGVVSLPESAQIEDRPFKQWRDTLASNLDSVFLCTKQVVARAMKPAGSGVIVNIASAAGLIGKDRRIYRDTPMGGATVDYHAAKGGVIAMTRDLAVYLAQFGIRVNSISPGGFWRGHSETFTRQYSELVPMRRMGEDGKELKGAVVFLASEASSYVTGIDLAVDGGLTAW
jgi:NAD(P)-dependent dehydrogenase (short-subunit alcohol dehydrogenase family)